ncbi:calcium-binding protein [Roseomonas sp. CCTCC AB2023176]|uniref:calcium-binding protein n=1 Tax=Roseomonas sp. CCTCC AB2023176 TaxID=3342640 RepID=UPI0035E28AF6
MSAGVVGLEVRAVTGGFEVSAQWLIVTGPLQARVLAALDWGDGTSAIVTAPQPGFAFVQEHTYTLTDGPIAGLASFAALLTDPPGGTVTNEARIYLDPGASAGVARTGWAGQDLMLGGVGADSLDGSGSGDTLYGGAGDDVLTGGAGRDGLYGGDGADDLLGGAGVDFLSGGNGNDTIRGGADGDQMDGGAGNDLLAGGSGDDNVFGDVGDDRLSGGDGKDTLVGGTGADTLGGGDGQDLLVGNAGADRLDGGAGDDILVGGAAGPDAPDGADILTGGDGNDLLIGNEGDDRLFGGTGADILYGGTGADRIVLEADGAMDVVQFVTLSEAGDRITGFTPGEDRIQLFFLGLTAVIPNADPLPNAPTGTLLFDTDTGRLSYDADGYAAGDAVLIATLVGVTSLSSADFFFG